LLVLPATGRTVDFHHTITRALPGAQIKPRNFKFLEDYGVSKITDFIVDSDQPCSELAVGSLGHSGPTFILTLEPLGINL